jgi:DNA-3-methyladenine glycosylase
MSVIERSFYNRDALHVARELLGCKLVRIQDGSRLVGMIMEAEAYQGEEDQGCHASAGKTPRTAVMYGPPGHAYVYFTYGMHWLLNVVTGDEGVPAAVLIRSIWPIEGMDAMAQNRPLHANKSGWLNGPAKLTQALKIDKTFNNVDLCETGSGLWIEYGTLIEDSDVMQTARIGLNSVSEPWRSIPWRFTVQSETLNEK